MKSHSERTHRMESISRWLVVCVAMAAMNVIEHARTIPGYERGSAAIWAGMLACPIFALIAGTLAGRDRPRRIMTPLLCGLAFSPFVMSLYGGMTSAVMPPLEKNLMHGIQAMIVASCLFLANAPQRQRLAALSGIMAIMCFASIVEMRSEAVWAMAFVTIAVPVWLYAEHEAARPARNDAPIAFETVDGRPKRRGVVLRLAAMGLLAIMGVSQIRGDKAINRVLAEWVGSSGGSGETNELATAGVGDGPNEVSASENADSVGFTDSDIYLETDRPSLFDAFNEQYGEPYKPRKTERMQAMGPQNVKESGERPRENLQAGRTFEMQRQKTAARRKPTDRPPTALVYVKGKAGTRLKLATFDRFDGQTWTEEAACTEPCRLAAEPTKSGDCWFCLHQPRPDLFGETTDHQVKIANLDSSVLPAPANLSKYKVGGLKEVTMFGWAGRDVVRMLDRTIPAGTTMQTLSRRVRRRHLIETDFETVHSHKVHHHHFREKGDYELSPAARTIVEGWDLGSERSWLQAERVIACIRDHAEAIKANGPSDPLPEDGSDVDMVERFLVSDRKGPDYLFATTAAVVLRDLGYACRLASGLYVDPSSWDASKAHYVLNPQHLHFWVEVLSPENVWVPIDPTPGYIDEFARESWADLAAIQLYALGHWAQQHRMPIGLTAAVAMLLIAFRKGIYDCLMTAYLTHAPIGDDRLRVLATSKHMEWRLTKSLGKRPPQRSLRSHWRQLACSPIELQSLLRLVEWAAYAPADRTPPCPANEIRNLCRTAACDWNRTAMQTWTPERRNLS